MRNRQSRYQWDFISRVLLHLAPEVKDALALFGLVRHTVFLYDKF